MADDLKITALRLPDLSRILSGAIGVDISEGDIKAIADAGGLMSDDTVSMIEFMAYLAKA